jgi:hypothetical protein
MDIARYNWVGRFTLAVWLGSGIAAAASVQDGAAPSATAQFAALRNAVHEARAHGDSAAYLKNALELHRLLNGSPTSTVDVMAAEVAAGHPDQALQRLKTLVNMRQSYAELLGTPSFAAMRSLPEYPAVAAAMSTNTRTQSIAERVFELQPIDWVPEDIDYDSVGQRFLITSVLKAQVLAVTWNGTSSLFATSPDAWPMMALKVDTLRKRVWVTEVLIGKSQSAVLLYDLKSGRLLHRISGPPQTDLGDMCLTRNGDAIVSDGGHGGVYRVNANSLKVERIDHGEFISPQTPAIAADGQQIWIPDYTRGIGLLDFNSKKVAWLATKDTYALGGVDGLYLYGQSLIVTQNGTSPERVTQFTLNGTLPEITSETTFERATPTLGDPTHGVVVGEYFYYIANSGWEALDDAAHRKAKQSMSPALLMRVKLAR